MLTPIPDLPAPLLGFRTTGSLTADDINNTLAPAVREQFDKTGSVRLLLAFESGFGAVSPTAWCALARFAACNCFRFSKLAIATDNWLVRRCFWCAFCQRPCRVFGLDELARAEAWLVEQGEIGLDLDEEHGVLLVEPPAPLEREHFQEVARVVDERVAAGGPLAGLIINTRRFPGWAGPGAFAGHFDFVRAHHDKLRCIALVTDSPLAWFAEKGGGCLLDAQVRRFPHGNVAAARAWILDAAE